MAIRLERDAREMRQVIWGWNGRRTVFLESERDLSGALRACTAGAFVTWKGRLTERDEFSETWSVTSIDAVEGPPGFRPRPPDSPRPGEDPGGPGAEGSEAGG